MSDESKKQENQASGTQTDMSKYVPKEELDKLQGSVKDLEKQLDEAKLSLLDPEYISYLDAKKQNKVERSISKSVSDTLKDRDISKLSSAEVLDLAVERAVEAVQENIIAPLAQDNARVKQTLSDVLAVLELQDIEKKHSDFSEYRDDVRKIIESSKVPLTFEQAYLQAKAIHLSEEKDKREKEEEEKKPRFSSEKPSRSLPSSSVQKTEFKNKEEAAEDAWDQVIGRGVDVL